ncbi:MAG: hypothetical protein K2N56_12120 [Oscillospiraceae bacterium]|nr:hypothetical protein [Oscillospiraceae bacterium]
MEDYTLKPEPKPKASAAKTVIICIVFGLLAFIFAFGSAALLCVRNTLSQSEISGAVSGINPADWKLGMFMDDDQIDEFAYALYLPRNRIGKDTTISDMIRESAAQYGISINPLDIEELLEKSQIMPAIGGLVGAYEHYLLTGEDTEPFSRKNLFSEIEKHESEINQYLDVDISFFYSGIKLTLREISGVLNRLNPSVLTEGAGKYTSVILSVPVIIAFFAVSVVMAVLALIITKRPVACVRTFGIVLTAVGSIFIAAALVQPIVLKMVFTMRRPQTADYISTLLNGSVTPIFLRNGAIFAGAGLLLIAVSVVCGIIVKKIAAKKTETQTVDIV